MESEICCEICKKPWPTLDAYKEHLLTYNHWNDINSIFQEKIDESYSVVGQKQKIPRITTLQKDPEKFYVGGTKEPLNSHHSQERSNIHESDEKPSINQSANEVFLNDDKKQMNNSFSATLQKTAVDTLLEENLENCKLCGTKFTGPEMARSHYESLKHEKKVMFVKSGKQNCINECKICNKFFIGIDQQINHFKSIKHLIKAGVITDTEENEKSESQKKDIIRNAKRCRLCDKFFISNDQAVKHFYSIQHKKQVVMSRTRERRGLHAINSTDKRLVEVSQELIVNYLASTCDPAGRPIIENEPSFSCNDVVTLLEKAVAYQVIKEFKCDICKKYFNNLNHSRIHLSKVQHICRIEEAKTLFTDGSFALYQQNIQKDNTNHNAISVEGAPQHNMPENAIGVEAAPQHNMPENAISVEAAPEHSMPENISQILSLCEMMQQPTPLIPMSVDEKLCEGQIMYNKNEMCSDRQSMLSHPSIITDGLLKGITPGALTEANLLTNPVIDQGRYETQSNICNLLMNQSHINENLLQVLTDSLIQSQGSAVQGIVSNRSLYNNDFPTTFASFHEGKSNSQSCFSSGQTFEKGNQHQNMRDRSPETERDYSYHDRRGRLTETERDYQNHNRGARSPDKERNYRFQSKRDRERRHSRWEKQLDDDSSSKRRSTKWDDLNYDLSRERRKNHSDSYRERRKSHSDNYRERTKNHSDNYRERSKNHSDSYREIQFNYNANRSSSKWN